MRVASCHGAVPLVCESCPSNTEDHNDGQIAVGRFSYDQMLDPKGNTAVYVLYAYARIAGVLRRAEHDVSSLSASDLSLTEPSVSWLRRDVALTKERALALRLMRLPEVLTLLEDDLLPSRLIATWFAKPSSSVEVGRGYTAARDG
eukprot:Skav201701  [mRNA]  locus=scaffold641:987679:990289:- [translate_table: standard]